DAGGTHIDDGRHSAPRGIAVRHVGGTGGGPSLDHRHQSARQWLDGSRGQGALDAAVGENSRQGPRWGAVRCSYRTSDAEAFRMISAAARRRAHERGFTLIETIVALALMGLLLSALAS